MGLSFFQTIFQPCGAGYNPPLSPPPTSPNKNKAMGLKTTGIKGGTLNSDYVTPGEHENFVVDKVQTSQVEDKLVKKDMHTERRGNTTPRKTLEVALTPDVEEVLGIEWLGAIASTKWDDRSGALDSMRRTLERGETTLGEHEAVFKAGAYMLSKCLPDRVLPVYLSAIELGEHLVTVYAAKHEIKVSTVSEYTDMMLPAIITRTSERNARTVEATQRVILALAKSPSIGCRGVMSHILVTVANSKDYAAIKGRLQLLELMIEEFGFSKSSGLSLSAVMAYVRPQLEASDEKVRMAAVEVTVSCYFHKGERTQQYVANLKPALLKLLEARFSEVGTKKSSKDKKKKAKNNKMPGGRLAPIRGQNGKRQAPGGGLPKLGDSRGSSRQSTSSTEQSLSNRQSTSAGSAGSLGSQKAPLAPLGPIGGNRLVLGGSPGLSGESGKESKAPGSMSWSNSEEGLFQQDSLHATLHSMELASLKGMGGDVLSPPVRHGGLAEDPMSPAMAHPWLSDPNEDKAPSFTASMSNLPLVNPGRQRAASRALNLDDDGDDEVLIEEDEEEALDFERAERLMDEIEGLY